MIARVYSFSLITRDCSLYKPVIALPFNNVGSVFSFYNVESLFSLIARHQFSYLRILDIIVHFMRLLLVLLIS